MTTEPNTKTFEPARPIWCAGCGDFAVQGVLEKSLKNMGIPAHKLMLLAGIGCSGTIQNNLKCYGYHALHGERGFLAIFQGWYGCCSLQVNPIWERAMKNFSSLTYFPCSRKCSKYFE